MNCKAFEAVICFSEAPINSRSHTNVETNVGSLKPFVLLRGEAADCGKWYYRGYVFKKQIKITAKNRTKHVLSIIS